MMSGTFTGGDMDKFKPKSSKQVLDRIDGMRHRPIVLFMVARPFRSAASAAPACDPGPAVAQVRGARRASGRHAAAGHQGLQRVAHHPQLFLCGEFIGGSDIVLELYQSGELLG